MRVQHQSGLNPDALELEIVDSPGHSFVKEVTRGMTVDGQHVRWKGFLTKDRDFEVRFSSGRKSL